MKKLLIILFIFTIFVVKANTPFEQGFQNGFKRAYLSDCSVCKKLYVPHIPMVYDKSLYSDYYRGYQLGYFYYFNTTKIED